MIAQHITYGTRIGAGDHWRWCAVCGKQQPTTRGEFIRHWKPNAKPDDPPCPNSGQKVAKTEQAG